MRIVIVSGIFEPESGGPATYAPRLAEELSKQGDTVTVVTYSSNAGQTSAARYPFRLVRVRRGNKFFNRFRFFFAALLPIARADVVYMLDWFAAGFPAALVARLCSKPYIVRIGGDYLWEQRYLESGQHPVTLRTFYERGLYAMPEYRMYRFLISYVLSGARMLVFNAARMRDLYTTYYDFEPAKMAVIENPVPTIDSSIQRNAPTNEIVFWGRLIEMKNVSALIRAFAKAELPPAYTLAIIGDGPQKTKLASLARELGIAARVSFEAALPRDRALARVQNARAFVLPSWTDIAPNQVYEAIALGLPALVTRENYLEMRDELPEMIDPLSVDDIAAKLRLVADDASYERIQKAFRSLRVSRPWKNVAHEHRALFERVL